MKELEDCSDPRMHGYCVYCGGPYEEDDHVPALAFLDKPHPTYSHKVESCSECNRSHSFDEEYVACFFDVVRVGTTESGRGLRRKTEATFSHNPRLKARIESSGATENGRLVWKPERDRVDAVVLKIARGHAAYDLGEPMLKDPTLVTISPVELMDEDSLAAFLSIPSLTMWPEVGSRAMQKLVEGSPDVSDDWTVVQPGRYRFMAIANPRQICIIFSEFLAAQVLWEA